MKRLCILRGHPSLDEDSGVEKGHGRSGSSWSLCQIPVAVAVANCERRLQPVVLEIGTDSFWLINLSGAGGVVAGEHVQEVVGTTATRTVQLERRSRLLVTMEDNEDSRCVSFPSLQTLVACMGHTGPIHGNILELISRDIWYALLMSARRLWRFGRNSPMGRDSLVHLVLSTG